jgi:hypothetical protein
MKAWKLNKIIKAICNKKSSLTVFKNFKLWKKRYLFKINILNIVLINTNNLISIFSYFWIKKKLNKQTLLITMRSSKVSLRGAYFGGSSCHRSKEASSLTDLEYFTTK